MDFICWVLRSLDNHKLDAYRSWQVARAILRTSDEYKNNENCWCVVFKHNFKLVLCMVGTNVCVTAAECVFFFCFVFFSSLKLQFVAVQLLYWHIRLSWKAVFKASLPRWITKRIWVTILSFFLHLSFFFLLSKRLLLLAAPFRGLHS